MNVESSAGAAPRRVVAIGIDGGSFRVLRPWMAEGHLPNFARIAREGAVGTLMSTIPQIGRAHV